MLGSSARRLLAVAYLLPVSAAVAALVVLGFLLDGLPLPAAVGRGYERGLFAAVEAMTRPVDGLACRPADR